MQLATEIKTWEMILRRQKLASKLFAKNKKPMKMDTIICK